MNFTPRSRFCAGIVSASFVSIFTLQAHAADGTWTNTTTGGLWSGDGNWASANIADGSDFTAFFNTLDIAAATTVNLDSARTIGTLHFSDTLTGTGTNGSWILANNGNAANVLTLGGAATITVDAMASVNAASSNVTISAIIAGVNGLTYDGNGVNTTAQNNTTSTSTLTLSGANTYTGATDIDSGTLRVTNASAFGGVAGGKLATNVVNIASGARLILGGANIANTLNIYGANALSTTGGSNLSGTVNLHANSNAWVNNNGNHTLTFSGTLNLSDYVLTAHPAGENNGVVISGTITGAGASGISLDGNGPLTISGDNTGYAGATRLMRGRLQLGSDTALGTGELVITPANSNSVTIRSTGTDARTISNAISLPTSVNNGNSSGKFIFGSSAPATNGNLTFTNTTDISMGSTPRTFQVYNRTQFDAGFTSTGAGGLTLETGTGTLVLNGNSTYTGATAVNAGTLLVNGSLSNSSAVTIASGARIGGTGSVGNVTFNSGAAFAFEVANVAQGGDGLTTTGFSGAGVGSFTLYLSGAAVGFDADSNYTWAVLSSSNATHIDGIVLTNITLDTSGFGQAFTGDFSLSKDAGSIYVNYVGTAIPEPSTYALLAGGMFLGFALTRRRRA